MRKISLAESDAEITECFSVMSELRPHIQEKNFLPRIKKLAEMSGLRLAFLLDGEVKAVAGFRIGEGLAFDGKYLEIEDLVTKSGERSKGYGSELFDWLVAHARKNDCNQLRLVSKVERTDAHRFYRRKGMSHIAHYFSMNLNEIHKKKLSLRIAALEDAEAIAAVLLESFAECESSYTPRAYAITVSCLEEIKKRLGVETIWVSEVGDKIIGTVGVVPKQDSLYIRSMAILPEAQGKGIGERLLKEIEDYAVARNYRRLFLNTTPFLHRAIRLYEKFGFRVCGADDLFGTSLVTMEKFLASAAEVERVTDT